MRTYPGDRTELAGRIRSLAAERGAVILAHNYQLAEVQEVADFLGDSLDLSIKAASTEADVIVFCGVHFMAETAAILSPRKTVLLPEPAAGCPMADMVDAESLRAVKDRHPGAAVVCYVNTSAEVKAESEVCCTSANAAAVVRRVPEDREIVFLPDRNLGANVQAETGRDRMVLWPGCCNVHDRIRPHHVERRRAEFPEAALVVHPECRPEVVRLADRAESTSGMVRFAAETEARTVLVGTELGLLARLARENPGKTFVPVTEQAVCPNMKLTTLESVLGALETMEPRVTVAEDVRVRAEAAVRRMTETGPLAGP